MRKSAWSFVAGLVVLSVAILILAGGTVWVARTVHRTVLEGTEPIAAGSFLDVPFVARGGFAEFLYEFAVESGPPVDVYLLTGQSYEDYLVGRPVSISSDAFVHEGVRGVVDSPYFPEGTWHAIVDNTDYGFALPGNASATATVRYRIEGGDHSVLATLLLWGLGYVVLVVGGSLVYIGIRSAFPGKLPRPAMK